MVYPEAKLEIENGLHQLETLLESTVDKAFDKFEIYVLRNILTVPEDLIHWVRLRHYEVRDAQDSQNKYLANPTCPTESFIYSVTRYTDP